MGQVGRRLTEKNTPVKQESTLELRYRLLDSWCWQRSRNVNFEISWSEWKLDCAQRPRIPPRLLHCLGDRGCVVGEKRGGAPCRVKIDNIKPDLRHIRSNVGFVKLSARHEYNTHKHWPTRCMVKTDYWCSWPLINYGPISGMSVRALCRRPHRDSRPLYCIRCVVPLFDGSARPPARSFQRNVPDQTAPRRQPDVVRPLTVQSWASSSRHSLTLCPGRRRRRQRIPACSTASQPVQFFVFCCCCGSCCCQGTESPTGSRRLGDGRCCCHNR